jgi:predicted dehydrogenase
MSQVFGQRGMLTCNNERPMCGMESQIGLRGRLAEPIYFSFSSRYQLAYINEMEHFLDVIQGERGAVIYISNSKHVEIQY